MDKKLTLHQLVWYVITFSVLGLWIETIYCFVTTGNLESRKGLILGPFCPIYGIGATFLIILLKDYKENKVQLLLSGALIGTIFEYICSYILQVLYGSRFWDYSYTTYQINGRISLTYTMFWGIISVILVAYIKPFIDKNIKTIPKKYWDKIIIIFLLVDMIVTIMAISTYVDRAKCKYEKIYRQEIILDKIFNNDIMVTIFPNLRYINRDGKEIFIKEIL